MTDTTSTAGALLKRYRLAAGLSQEALAGQAGVSVRAVSDIERGIHRAPRGATLLLLADALALTPERRALLLAAAHPGAAPDDPPPVPPPSTRAGRLPAPPGPLLGRARELDAASHWIGADSRRMLTLTGPGGAGKTRLALEIARIHSERFPGAPVFVDLAPLTDPAQVPSAITAALDLADLPDMTPGARVAAHLGAQRALFLLDNAERVAGAAPFLADLLARCPGLYLLVTSRVPLKLRAERVLLAGPLEPADAEALFRDLCHDASPAGDARQADITAICARVDYLPLAIELAAAQTAASPIALVRERLSARLEALGDGPRDLPARQRTMRATLDWSYELLPRASQAALRALSAFASGWTLDAARAALDADPFDALAALVEASLVTVDIVEGAPARWRLLDLTHEYAQAHLRAAGEEDAVMRRLAAYYAEQAQRIIMRGPEPSASLAQADLPNARAALEWAERQRDAALGLRLAFFARVWHSCGQLREAASWIERMLALDATARAAGAPTAPASMRVMALCGRARISMGLGDPARAEAALHDALRLGSEIGDHVGLAEAYATLGDLARADSRLDVALQAYAESAAHARHAPASYPPHRALSRLADMEMLRSDPEQATRNLEDALSAARACSSSWEVTMILLRLAGLARQLRRHAQARAYYQESLSALETYTESAFTAHALEGLALTLGAEGRHAAAVRLYSGAAAIRQRGDSPAPAAEAAAIEEALARARIALGEPRYRAERRAGATLAPAALLAEARLHASGTRASGASPKAKQRGQ
ncbi:MAG TPA: helix-turn-helix domain-containing protein [Ktedonobacterales bacterium]